MSDMRRKPFPDMRPVISFWKDSLAGRALRFTAAMVGLVVVISTAVSYWVVFRNAEKDRLEALGEYASERARRENMSFKLAEEYHSVLKAAFIKRWNQPDPENMEERFDAVFAKGTDGAWRSRRDLIDPLREPSTWIRAGREITPELKRMVMICHDLTFQYFDAWAPQFKSLYISSPYEFNTGIAPDLPEWVWQIAPDFDQNNHVWGLLASREHNPDRRSLWTGVFYDIAAGDTSPSSLYVTLCTPVDVGGRHMITAHLDIQISELLQRAVAVERPGLSHLIFRPDGKVIIGGGLMERIAQSKGELTLQNSGDPVLQSIYKLASAQSNFPYTGYDPVSDRYLAITHLEHPGWLFVSMVPRADLREQAFRSAQWVLWSGLGVLLVSLALISGSFRTQVARPLSQLLAMTQRLKAGETDVRIQVNTTREDEIGELARSFNEMADRVSERDAAVRASERRWRLLFEQSPLSVQFFSPDGHSLRVNKAWEQLTGLQHEAISGWNLLKDEQLKAAGLMPHFERAFKGEVVAIPPTLYDTEQARFVGEHTGAKLKWISAILFPLFDDDGKLIEVVAIHEDVTARKVAEEEIRKLNQELEQRVTERAAALRVSEERLRMILEHTPIAIVTLDAETGRFVDANDQALLLFGLSREEFLSVGPADLSPERQPDGRLSREVAMEKIRAARNGGSSAFEWTHINAGGQKVQCEIRLAPMPSSGQNLVVGNLLDITAWKRAEEELMNALTRERELSELKTNFVSLVSHEFRTPLGVIMSATDVLQRYFDRLPAEKRARHLDMIFRSTRNLAALIEEVLLLGKVEDGRMQFTPVPVDLETLCRNFVDEVTSATNASCPIQFTVHGSVAGAVSDESLLRHTLTNLLSNAVKYSAPGTPVEFSVERQGSAAVFTIRDRGIGIPKEDQARLFTTFSRGRNVGDRPGTGLGLVIVHRCVRLHRGKIQLQSEPGTGTTVIVHLPVFSLKPAPDAQLQSASS